MQSERASLSFPGKNVSFLYIVTAPKKVIEFFVISLLILALSSFVNDTAEQEKVWERDRERERERGNVIIL